MSEDKDAIVASQRCTCLGASNVGFIALEPEHGDVHLYSVLMLRFQYESVE